MCLLPWLSHSSLPKVDAVHIAREELLAQRTRADRGGWHPVWSIVAYNVWLLLISTRTKIEFAPELLLPFTMQSYRDLDAWSAVVRDSPAGKYALPPDWALVEALFDACHNESVVRHTLATGTAPPPFLRRVLCMSEQQQSQASCPALANQQNERGRTAATCPAGCGCEGRNAMFVTPALALAISAASVLTAGRFQELSSEGNAVLLFQKRLQSALAGTFPVTMPADNKVPFVMGVQRGFAQGGGMLFAEHGTHRLALLVGADDYCKGFVHLTRCKSLRCPNRWGPRLRWKRFASLASQSPR